MTGIGLSKQNTFVARGAILFALQLLIPNAYAERINKAGWIESVGLNNSVPAAVKIMRKGEGAIDEEIIYNEVDGLRACDKIKLVDSKSVVHVTLFNAQRLRMDKLSPEIVVPCDSLGFSDTASRLFQAFMGRADERRRTSAAVSRGLVAATKGAPEDEISMPVLVAPQAMVESGARALYVAWRGGVAPFSVEIVRHGGNEVLVSSKGISRHDVTLPKTTFPIGQYSLIVKSATGGKLRESQLYFVATTDLPPMPRELKDTKIPESVRALLYADVLVGFEDGRFTMEAQQKVAAISPQTPASRDWLRAWGEDN